MLHSFLTVTNYFAFQAENQSIDQMDDIKLLKIEVQNTRYKNDLLTRNVANTIDMRQEALQLHRNLTLERVKSKALEEEMRSPMNIHRWRQLGGRDPEKLDLIVKIQTLQK